MVVCFLKSCTFATVNHIQTMLKKITLLLIISSITVFGFAQKSKRKAIASAPKNTYFEMLINGQNTPESRYCPYDTILFTFIQLDSNITEYSFRWRFTNSYYYTDSLKLSFSAAGSHIVSLFIDSIYLQAPTDTIPVLDTVDVTLTAAINVDYIRTILETSVCQGRDIAVVNAFGDTIKYNNVQRDEQTDWDTLQSASGCDSLVCWLIIMDKYISREHSISSCDSVIWGDTIIKRPADYVGDYETKVERIFFADNPDSSCDTLVTLTITIIDPDTTQLAIIFDQKKFCSGEDMLGTMSLSTNFTAFDWTYKRDKEYKEIDSTFTLFTKDFDIEIPGYYHVLAYMDTSLYDTLRDLRIVNCYAMIDTLVEDCPLIIPNIITPNGDGYNDVFGIKKLILERENELTIYDRWGKSVFHQKNYKCVFKNNEYHNEEDAFKGLSRSGQKLSDGIYYYALKYNAIPKKKTYTGMLTILRD